MALSNLKHEERQDDCARRAKFDAADTLNHFTPRRQDAKSLRLSFGAKRLSTLEMAPAAPEDAPFLGGLASWRETISAGDWPERLGDLRVSIQRRAAGR